VISSSISAKAWGTVVQWTSPSPRTRRAPRRRKPHDRSSAEDRAARITRRRPSRRKRRRRAKAMSSLVSKEIHGIACMRDIVVRRPPGAVDLEFDVLGLRISRVAPRAAAARRPTNSSSDWTDRADRISASSSRAPDRRRDFPQRQTNGEAFTFSRLIGDVARHEPLRSAPHRSAP